MGQPAHKVEAVTSNLEFPHNWRAEVLTKAPLIAPAAILPTITRDVASAKNPIVSSSFQVSESYPHRKR